MSILEVYSIWARRFKRGSNQGTMLDNVTVPLVIRIV